MKNNLVTAEEAIERIHDSGTLTSAFLRNKLGETMHARGLPPHSFETRAEAEVANAP